MTRVPTTPPEPSGRLELTWTNKHLRLLAHDDTTYEWCDPADYRVAEVRLLNEVTTVGDDPGDNLVIQGDALHALTALTTVPEYRERYVGKVKCCYIDPPFNTGQTFTQYDDALEHSVWLTMLRDRLAQIKQLMHPEGTIWVHLDDAEVHRARSVLDEELGMECHVGTIVWQKVTSPRNDTTGFSVSQDYILVYSPTGEWTPNRMARLASSNTSRYKSRDKDPIPWRDGDATAGQASTHQHMVYAIQHPVTGGLMYPTPGRCWGKAQSWFLEQLNQYAKYELRDIGDEDRRATICATTPSKVKQGVPAIMLAVPLADAASTARARHAAGLWPELVFLDIEKERIQRKKHLADAGRVPETLWLASDVGGSLRGKNEVRDLFPGSHAFATPKPEQLLQRIIHIATDPGDLVLDCFAGSGTTAAVANKMDRRWVTVERSAETVETFVVPRLRKVVDGTDTGGISTEVVEHDDGCDLPDGMVPAEGKAAVSALDKLRAHGTFDDLDTAVVKIIQSVLRKAAKEPEGLPNSVDADTVKAMVRTFKALDDADLFAELNETVTKKMTSAVRAAAKTRSEAVVRWAGGGGFRVAEVAPSIYETVDEFVVLAEWMTAGELARSVAAQVGYSFEPDGPFTGRKGRSRLTVIDGLLTRDVIDFLVGQLGEKERLLVVAHALEPGVEEYARDAVAGSRVRKIPRDLVQTSSGPRRLVNLAERPTGRDDAVEEVAS